MGRALLGVWLAGAVILGIGLHYIGAGPGCRPWKQPIHFAICVAVGLVWPAWMIAVLLDRWRARG